MAHYITLICIYLLVVGRVDTSYSCPCGGGARHRSVAYRERLLWEKTKLHQADSAGEEVAVNLASNIGLYLSHINDSSDCPPLGTRGPLSGPLRSRTLIPW